MYNLFIFRRDFRLYDNNGLIKCFNLGLNNIIPIFIFTPEQIDKSKNKYYSHNCVQFMLESLNDLNIEINKKEKEKNSNSNKIKINKKLYTFYGDNIEVLTKICNIISIENIIFSKDYTSYAIKRDKCIKDFCKKKKIKCIETEDYLLAPIKTFNKGSNTDDNYSVYTSFKNGVINHKELIQSVNDINISDIRNLFTYIPNNTLNDIKLKFKDKYDYLNELWCDVNKSYNNNIIYKGGRKNGLLNLQKIKGQYDYNNNRNDMSKYTTLLSAYIKFGCISIREVFFAILNSLNKEQKKDLFNIGLLNQIIWREFYYYIAYYNPYILNKKKNLYIKKYNNIKWENNKVWFNKWCCGQTGFPIVDSCMIELNTTGYMHNRGRLITSSFIRLLNIDWKLAERYFANKLVDYDPIVNNLNWQNQMGTGTGKRPVSQQILNPIIQSKKFDKKCIYIKKWLPNLNNIKNTHLHDWEKYYNEYDLKKIQYYAPILNYKSQKEKNIKYNKI